jgi:UDP-3-O-[3-hydroxymyristoyl] glucosamine N-acyltransferase
MDGFGYYLGGPSPLKVPQVGRVVVGDDVEIGACTVIQRATLDSTTIGNRVKIGDQVTIGHNVRIGDDVVIVGQSFISGSVKVGNSVRMWSRVNVRGHLIIGDRALILADSFVIESVPNDQIVGGSPALPHIQWKRIVVGLSRLPEIIREFGKHRNTKEPQQKNQPDRE